MTATSRRRSSTGSPACRSGSARQSPAANCTKADALLILNTFEDPDADVLAALGTMRPHIYTIGPLGSLLRSHNNGATADTIGVLSFWKQDTGCLTWLDRQEQGSVVYANFGSHTVRWCRQSSWPSSRGASRRASGHPFLWTVRDDAVLGTLPPAFILICSGDGEGRCLVTTWWDAS
jgi:hypothetical protein